MFDPSVADVRDFFCGVWMKHQARMPLTALEAIAADWIEQHPEYHLELLNADEAKARDYSPQTGRSNPFLHLAMHLSIHEQVSIDQPVGIRAAMEALTRRTGSAHDAAHVLAECLGEALWKAQRTGEAIDEEAYRRAFSSRAGSSLN